MDIVTLGELLIDMLPDEAGKSLAEISAFYPKPGGAPANVAIAARRLGAKTAFIGKVGADLFGYHLRDVLRVEGVDTRALRYDSDARTTLAVVLMPDPQHPDFVFYRNPGADMRLTPHELDLDLLAETRAFHFGSLSLTHEPIRSAALTAVQAAEGSGALISFDANFRPALWSSPDEAVTRIRTMLPFVNLLKVNEVELNLLSGTDDPDAGSRILLDHGPDLVLITLGAHGAYFRTEAGGGPVPAYRARTVDTVGCGDAFIGAVLHKLISGRGTWRDHLQTNYLYEAVRYGNAVGALTSQKAGGIPSLPYAREVDTFIANQILTS